MTSVQEIDFAKYRTDELFEQVSDLLNPGAIVWKVLKWTAVWSVLLAIVGCLICFGLRSWMFLILFVPIALFVGFTCGFPFGLARAVRSAIDRLSQLLLLIMNTVQRIIDDCRDLKSGKQQLPKRSELVYAVYAKVMLPTIEKVLVNRLGFIAKPVFWAYRLTLGRVVRGYVRKNADEMPEEELAAISHVTETVVEKVDQQHDRVKHAIRTGQSWTEYVGGILKTGCSIPLYAAFVATLLAGLFVLVGLRTTIGHGESQVNDDSPVQVELERKNKRALAEEND